MKKILTFISLCAFPGFCQAQLSLSPNQTASTLVNTLVATSGTSGVTVSNVQLNCDTSANGLFSGISNLGISNGIVLGSGSIQSDPLNFTYGLDGVALDVSSTALGTSGDNDLTTIISAPTYDACILEFDLQPVGNFVEFEYIFGSEEYPEYNCTAFNDVFAFLISGPGITGTDNMAIVPGSTIPVSINSINDGTGGCSTNQSLYVTNTGSTVTLDGFTTPLIATHTVTPGSTYHLKMALADVSDAIFNSYVVLKANSLKSGSTNPSGVSGLQADADLQVYPSIVNEELHFRQVNAQLLSIAVRDLQGKVFILTQRNEKSFVLDTSSLPQGVYLVNTQNFSTGKHSSLRIVKQ